MDSQGPQGQSSVPGPAGRRINVAHRRTPSSLTPLLMEQLALQQQIEHLQQQQQQIAHQQYMNLGNMGNMGMMQSQQPIPQQGYPQMQGFQLSPMQAQQQLGIHMGNANQAGSHRRNQSALPNVGMGPPPAPSTGASGAAGYGDNGQAQGQNNGNHGRENSNQARRGGGPPGGGHQRRHSLALPEARRAAELAQQKRTTSGFQFPIPGASGASPAGQNEALDEKPEDNSPTMAQQQPAQGLGVQRSGNIRGGGAHLRSQSMAVGNGRQATGRTTPGFQFSPAGETAGPAGADGARRTSQPGHGRSGSRNFDSNWRQQGGAQGGHNMGQQQQQQQQQGGGGFQPGHRARGSINQSVGNFQFPNQQQLLQLPQGQMVMPQMFPGQPQQYNPMQLAQLQAQLQSGQLNGMQANVQMTPQQQQQQRKTLFTPYLAQSSLPGLLAAGQLVTGILRVNKKNRSDAYVSCADLDADIFICGSKDRNRALEGDLVAIELLDVDEVWSQKREKEEKKKRKDITDTRSGSAAGLDRGGRSDSNANADNQQVGPDGSIRRRGSLRQRPTQKKNDDVEVEGQSLLLVEEDEISDDHKPLYSGHVVAVIERVPGQMFSGSLGLLRPSSQATKEKQELERVRDGHHGREERRAEKPKIVWFKPTDKRVPLIAIPTEQAPRDFLEKHANYANDIFVACIKRWPITSLHPFGTLVEQLGLMGDLRVETDALLRDNNFASDEFPASVLDKLGFENWSIDQEDAEALQSRRDFRSENTFTIDPNGTKELDDAIHIKSVDGGKVEIGIHVADVSHFIKPNTPIDREAKKRGSGVYLINRVVSMLPSRLSNEILALLPGEQRLTMSVVFKVDPKSGAVEGEPWIGKGLIKSSGKLSYHDVDKVIHGSDDVQLGGVTVGDIKMLFDITRKFREARLGHRSERLQPLRLLYQLDDENVPVERNIFNSTPAHEAIEELSYKANHFVAKKIVAAFPEKAFLRRQAPPNFRRMQTFVERMNNLGYEIDSSSSGLVQNSLFKVEDDDLRKGMETLLLKAMGRGKYYISGNVSEQDRPHFILNLPIYTHFTNPFRRYADIIVHRQLEAALSGATDWPEDMEAFAKLADQCNNKKDSAQTAQEQSVHIEACRAMDKERQEIGSELIAEGIVLCVYESAFDVLIPQYGFEKRVHCDQLPLKKAEFRKNDRVLELYWEKGVPSSTYIPEDERPKPALSARAANHAAAAREAEEARQRAREREEAQRRGTETSTISTDAVEDLFDDDDDLSEVADHLAGVSLNSNNNNNTDRSTQSMPPSPTRNGVAHPPHRTQSDPRIATTAGEATNGQMTNRERYGHLFELREEDGEYIQDVREMTRVPIILKIDLSKSPPCLTIRSMNPYAM
ncbi:uncharacterized protein GIQ15_05525 [Arthroderma uncinatum]|uniref:uncharacterized protein n=1 Tax=Arthroderma uncinatum TaxID=74035 RepID=UPI00144A5A90|nr:uncharacterized protein GIQ15_05525 [Arthroderma uncinatum]KAF3480178.1 hypothetical protein GIQ15_05525 [Arthroderma uncinatum]